MAEEVLYQRKTAILKFVASLSIVGAAIFLTYAIFYMDISFVRMTCSIISAILGYWLFGRYLLIFFVYMCKARTVLFHYDDHKIWTNDGEVYWHDIVKMKVKDAHSGLLRTRSPTFIFFCKNNKQFVIPTHYLLTQKEQHQLEKFLKKAVNERGLRQNRNQTDTGNQA